MKLTSRQTKLFSLVLIIVFAGLSACSTFQRKPPQEALKERVEGLMEAKVNNNWTKVYTFYDPNFKKTTTQEGFAGMNRGVSFSNFSIESIDIAPSGTEATVKVKYDVSMKGFDFKGTPEIQKWIKEGSHWYLHIKPINSDNPLG